MAFRMVGQRPQLELLLEHFEKIGNISALEAQHLFKVMALPRRIKDLELKGHVFKRDNRIDSTGQRYTRYHYLTSQAQT